jgi:hypothetical protein
MFSEMRLQVDYVGTNNIDSKTTTLVSKLIFIERRSPSRQKLKGMQHLVRKGRRIVKNEIEQKRWVEFGISATR